jgi:hypothetical protein
MTAVKTAFACAMFVETTKGALEQSPVLGQSCLSYLAYTFHTPVSESVLRDNLTEDACINGDAGAS